MRIWITIRHGGLGMRFKSHQWPYLSNATSWPYELRKPFTTARFFPHKNPYISNVTHATALQSNARLLNCASPTAVEFKFL